MKKLLFVYNPHSGKGEIGKSLSDIICIFTSAGYDVTVHPTSAPRDGEKYISGNAKDYDMVVSSGGDGMLHELFSGIIGTGGEMSCGYIPSGTINDFASSLKISKVPAEAAETVTGGSFTKVDAGVFNSEIFAYVAAFGLFTKVSYATDQNMKNALGAGAYFIEVLRSMDIKHFNEAKVHARITANGNEYEGDFIFGMAGNTYSVGSLTSLIPKDAKMDDGLLDLMFIKAPASLAELDKIRRALTEQNFDIPEIVSFKADSAEVFTERPVEWTLDGEFGGKTDHAQIGVRKQAVKIAAPSE